MPSDKNVPNDREDPRDCNPMYKRLGAEVVSRRRHDTIKGAAQTQAADACVDLEQVLEKRPEGRAKWLAKALSQAGEGRLTPQSLYDVVAHNRFIEDLTEKVGRKMYRALHASLSVFSSKQRKFLEKECALARTYASTAFSGPQKDDADEEASKKEAEATALEEMMARCRDFVRDKQVERGERGDEPPVAAGAGASAGAVVAALAAAAAVATAAASHAAAAAAAHAEKAPREERAAPAAPPAGSRSRSQSGKEKDGSKSQEKDKKGGRQDKARRSSSRSRGRRSSPKKTSKGEKRGRSSHSSGRSRETGSRQKSRRK
ncbi:unnamed protein product, partial [Polarella glacialis]